MESIPRWIGIRKLLDKHGNFTGYCSAHIWPSHYVHRLGKFRKKRYTKWQLIIVPIEDKNKYNIIDDQPDWLLYNTKSLMTSTNDSEYLSGIYYNMRK